MVSLHSSEARGTLRINFLAAASLAQPSCEKILWVASAQRLSSAKPQPPPRPGPPPTEAPSGAQVGAVPAPLASALPDVLEQLAGDLKGLRLGGGMQSCLNSAVSASSIELTKV